MPVPAYCQAAPPALIKNYPTGPAATANPSQATPIINTAASTCVRSVACAWLARRGRQHDQSYLVVLGRHFFVSKVSSRRPSTIDQTWQTSQYTITLPSTDTEHPFPVGPARLFLRTPRRPSSKVGKQRGVDAHLIRAWGERGKSPKIFFSKCA